MNDSAENARERLRKAATEIFAKKGFNRASIREICQLAGANGAAVHYYFGDKASLYREVTRPAAHLTDIPEAILNPKIGLREGLEAFFRPLTRTLSDASLTPHLRMLFVREQIQPTGLLDAECTDFFRPRHEQLCQFLSRQCGTPQADESISHLALSLVGMAMILFMKPDVVQAFAPTLLSDEAAVEATLQRLTDQAVTLVLAEASRRAEQAKAAVSR